MRAGNVIRRFLLLGLAAIMLASPVIAGVKDRMFSHADAALAAADEVNAAVLSPAAYGDAMRAYKSAEDKFNSGKSVDSVQKKLMDAERNFEKAKLVAEIAGEKLGGLIKARADARAVEAYQFSKRNWQRAENYNRDAISFLENGRQKLALQRAGEAIPIYRELELTAIKAQYLDETRVLIAQAKKDRAHKYAPKTFQAAQVLLAEAERELTENRYDADKPRGLAREAQYEAQHSIYLTKYIREARTRQRSMEDIILDWQSPVVEIAAAADMVAHFEQGHQATTVEVVEYIEDHNFDAQKLQQEIADRDQEIFALSEDNRELQDRLGDEAVLQQQLQRRLARQEEIRQKVLELEKTFERAEANVFRDSNQVYIRLVGLNFDSGSSQIKSDHYALLGKVHDAITVFPGSEIYIEGHTDSYGGDDSNLVLSEDRANSVRSYFMAHTSLPSDSMQAIGYGENKPVANNETPQGRTKNRRIDIRIVPNLDLSQT